MSDNVTAVAFNKNMSGCMSPCRNNIVHNVWEWASIRNLWLSAAHIPGAHNVIAGSESRQFRDASDWMISDKIFKKLCKPEEKVCGENLILVFLLQD